MTLVRIDDETLCRIAGVDTATLAVCVLEGLLDWDASRPDLPAQAVARFCRAARLQRELAIDWSAVGYVLDLIETRERLEARIAVLERLAHGPVIEI